MNAETGAGADKLTAAILIIGDEILSGRTQETNSGYIANYLAELGVDLHEVRIVRDNHQEIVDAVNALRARYTYVFSTGGIGPTHDDITAEAMAAAFQSDIIEDPRAIEMLLERIPPEKLNAARRRMARIPVGAELVKNLVSAAPGFMLGNVIVMAGVPLVMQAMLDAVAPRLATSQRMLVVAVEAGDIPEGRYADALAAAQNDNPAVRIGSYPHFSAAGVRNQIVLRSRDRGALDRAEQAVRALLSGLTNDRAPG